MKLCLVSDSHDRAPALLAAVRAGRDAGAQAVVHCGDVIGAQTLRPLVEVGLPVHFVHGNNLGDPVAMAKVCAESQGLLVYHGADADLRLGGRRLFATHYPHYARGLACTGDYDVVCCGHSHEASVIRQPTLGGGTAWLVNPGTVAGLGAPAAWVLADLAGLAFEIRPLA
ncbi:MAG: metallophosphatase family protein [Betaproteobacteria bacterium]|jgi:putative phosphoesterase|nr:metallophosphatase family protein [Betaproteobacteria bacterium]